MQWGITVMPLYPIFIGFLIGAFIGFFYRMSDRTQPSFTQ